MAKKASAPAPKKSATAPKSAKTNSKGFPGKPGAPYKLD